MGLNFGARHLLQSQSKERRKLVDRFLGVLQRCCKLGSKSGGVILTVVRNQRGEKSS